MRVAVLGASRYNVPVLAAIREAGFSVLAIDGNPAAPGLAVADASAVADIRDAAALRTAIESAGSVDGIVTLGEAAVRSTAQVCRELGLPSISEEAAFRATSKAAMRRAWDAIPRYNVPWRAVQTEEDAIAAAGRFPVIVKPDRTHGGSRGVTRADDRAQLAAAFAYAQSSGMSGDVIVEQFIESVSEHSAEVLIHEGETSVLCSGTKIKTRAPYRVDLSVRYPSEIDDRVVNDMCARAIDAIGLTTGVAHIEFAWTPDGPRLLELGARCGGGHTPLLARHVSGVDEIVEACRLACGEPPRQLRPTYRRGGEYRFLAFSPGVIDEAIVPDDVREHPLVCDAEILGAKGAALRDVQTGADRAGFVVTFGETRDEAVEVADWAMGRMAVRYEDGEVRPPRPLAEIGELR